MENTNYDQLFKYLKIPVAPLSENYTPEKYGRSLYAHTMANSGVYYSATTDYKPDNQIMDIFKNNV